MNVSPSLESVSYAIQFQDDAGQVCNPALQGAGTFTVEPAGPTYVFSGKPRRLFSSGQDVRRFTATEIVNVTVEGRAVTFTPRAGAGAKRKEAAEVFVFFAATEADATAIAALLPQTREEAFEEQQAFARRLEAVAPARPVWMTATGTIIGINLGAFVIMAGPLGAGWLEPVLLPYVKYGANNGAATTDGEWWRLLTSMFLHYGVVHLALNMWALFDAGKLLERLLGTRLFIVTYLGAGLAGGFTSIAWYGDKTWSAGASGAVFGVYGALLGYTLRQKKAIPGSVFQGLLKSSLSFAGYNLLYGLARSGIDNAAHLGGAAAGLALGWLLALPLEPEARRSAAWPKLRLGVTAVALLVAAGAAFTPRFNYRIADELAFNEALTPVQNRENELLKHQQTELANLKTSQARTAHAAWMEREIVPFYRQLTAKVASLELTPGRRTMARRDALLEFFRLRLLAYEHLIVGLRKNDDGAVARYIEEDGQAVKVLAKLRAE